MLPIQDRSSIQERRVIPIENKVFSLADLHDMVNVVFDQYSQTKENAVTDKNFALTVTCDSNIEYFSNESNILIPDHPVAKKFIYTIKCEFQSHEKFISLNIDHSGTAEFSMGAYENMWVNAVEGKFMETLSTIKTQENPLRKSTILVSIIAFIAGTIATGYVFDLLVRHRKHLRPFWEMVFDKFEKQFYGDLMQVIPLTMVGGGGLLLILYYIYEHSKKIWPSIEIASGPEFKNKTKQKRNTWIFIFTAVILPILLSIFTEIFL